MKKLIVVLIFIAVLSPVFAQEQLPRIHSADDHYDSVNPHSDHMYFLNVPIDRIFPTSQGYIVQYRKNSADNSFGVVGIPNEWFTGAGAKAEYYVLPRGANWPSMSVFYVDGEFNHVRLYVHRSKSHRTWGNVPMGANLSPYFQDMDTLIVEF
jgi:hypothetical protein